jgi:hypothetical protein
VRLEQNTRALLVAAVPEIHLQGCLRTRAGMPSDSRTEPVMDAYVSTS